MPSPSFDEFDEPQFLEPAHYHDPAQISNIAGIPSALLNILPPEAQKSLFDVQESISVAYASYRRLQDMAKERFHRLIPAKNQDHDKGPIECRCNDMLNCPDRFQKCPLALVSVVRELH